MSKPRVSIGLPVFNGERFLAHTIDSVLAQTFEDFELLICDNASTDRTGEIARQYAQRDPRVKYLRNPMNMGASHNFNLAFMASGGEYFKWIAADDAIAPEFIERCVIALHLHPQASLAFTKIQNIDSDGHVVERYSMQPDMQWPRRDAVGRYRTFMDELTFGHTIRAWPMVYIFGLIRSDSLRRTKLMQRHVDSDSNLLAELILAGEFIEVPHYLHFIRQHEASYSFGAFTQQQRLAFFDPRLSHTRLGRIISTRWRWPEYVSGVMRANIGPGEKAALVIYNLSRLVRRAVHRVTAGLRTRPNLVSRKPAAALAAAAPGRRPPARDG